MDNRQLNLKVFERRGVDRVLFQPRLEPWFFWHQKFDSLPKKYRKMKVAELYDDLGASDRYFSHFTGLAEPIETHYDPAVRVQTEIVEDGGRQRKRTVFETPYGELAESRVMTVDGVWRKVEFAVKNDEDLKALEWLYTHSQAHFNAEAFAAGEEYQGNRGQPQFWIHGSPYETITQEWMGFEDFIFAMVDMPERMKQVFEVIDRSYDAMFEQIITHGEVKIVNFPENVHVARTPPEYFEKYLVPWYHKRSTQLRDQGIFTHIHIDGDFKPLLEHLKDLPFDGFEALTPKPQGDVILEEIREHMGDKILLDGIPAVLFLNHYSREQLQECVEKVVDYFFPRLILGISDELPQGGDAESLERIRWVADYCRTVSVQENSQ